MKKILMCFLIAFGSLLALMAEDSYNFYIDKTAINKIAIYQPGTDGSSDGQILSTPFVISSPAKTEICDVRFSSNELGTKTFRVQGVNGKLVNSGSTASIDYVLYFRIDGTDTPVSSSGTSFTFSDKDALPEKAKLFSLVVDLDDAEYAAATADKYADTIQIILGEGK